MNMIADQLKAILKNHKLRITESRIEILGFFLNHRKALSFRDLESALSGYDRVTLYRTLHSFTENGILHKIPDDTGFATYGLCHDTCDADSHHHHHIHFKCNECGTIECVEKDLPHYQLPGYEIQEANLVLNGICQSCGNG